MDWLKGKLLGWMFNGHKTYIAAVGAIAYGVYLVTEQKIEEGMAFITGGLATLGLGHKADKLTEAVKNGK